MKNKKVFILIFGLLIVGGFFLYQGVKAPSWFGGDNKPVQLLFVGDIMLARKIGSIVLEEQDPLYHFLRTAPVTQEADITFGNLETSVSRRGANVGSIYSFRADPDLLKGPAYAGFDVLSVANNHAFDWGVDAFVDTLSHTRENGMLPVGGGKSISEARSPALIDRKGTTFAFLAYSQFAPKSPPLDVPAIAPMNLEYMKEDIQLAKQEADVVIISLHWGDEYETSASAEQKMIGRALIDAGANLVIGHHPHVIQEVEEYGGGLIAYSLGNFVFDQNFSPDTRRGLLLSVTMKGSEIESFKRTELQFTERYQPYISAVYPMR